MTERAHLKQQGPVGDVPERERSQHGAVGHDVVEVDLLLLHVVVHEDLVEGAVVQDVMRVHVRGAHLPVTQKRSTVYYHAIGSQLHGWQCQNTSLHKCEI